LVTPLEPEGGYHGVQYLLSEQIKHRLAGVLVDLKRQDENRAQSELN
jgi:hypothetical protein